MDLCTRGSKAGIDIGDFFWEHRYVPKAYGKRSGNGTSLPLPFLSFLTQILAVQV